MPGNGSIKPKKIEVRNPFDNSIIDTVPKADAGDLEKALAYAERGAKVMAKLSSYERWKILRKAADLMAARNEELGQTISQEEGKIIAEGRGEASRAVETMMGSAEEAKRHPRRDRAAGRRSHRQQKIRLHVARAVRRGGGDHAVQFSAQSGLPQSRAGTGRGQCGHRQAGLRHAAVGA